MTRSTRLSAALAAALGVAALAPAAATAATSVTPTTLAFGNQAVGTTSAPKTSTIVVACGNVFTPPIGPQLCFDIAPFAPIISSSTPEFVQTNDCAPLYTPSLLEQSCAIDVTFTPSVAGPHSATITTGSDEISVDGVGAVPAPVGTNPTPAAPAKKCKKAKKKRSAQAAGKKCKKKKR